MLKKYDNGRWTNVVDTQDGGTATDASSGVLPERETPTEINTTTEGNGTGDTNSETEYTETVYDIISGTVNLTQADMDIKCRGAVKLKGLGPVFSSTYYVSGVKITLNATSMKQTLELHRDTLGGGSFDKKDKGDSKRPKSVGTKSNKKTYTVKRGDKGLSAIARSQLGDSSRWKEIYNLNKSEIGSNPNLIRAGQKLVLP